MSLFDYPHTCPMIDEIKNEMEEEINLCIESKIKNLKDNIIDKINEEINDTIDEIKNEMEEEINLYIDKFRDINSDIRYQAETQLDDKENELIELKDELKDKENELYNLEIEIERLEKIIEKIKEEN